MVQDLRKILDQISNEITDMTFKEERANLDKLLADKEKPALDKNIGDSGPEH